MNIDKGEPPALSLVSVNTRELTSVHTCIYKAHITLVHRHTTNTHTPVHTYIRLCAPIYLSILLVLMPPCRSDFSSFKDSQHSANSFRFLCASGLLAADHQLLLFENSAWSFFKKIYSFWRQKCQWKGCSFGIIRDLFRWPSLPLLYLVRNQSSLKHHFLYTMSYYLHPQHTHKTLRLSRFSSLSCSIL